MFRKLPTDNNGYFKDVPSNLITEIVDYSGNENLSRIGQLNKFFNQLSKDCIIALKPKVSEIYSSKNC